MTNVEIIAELTGMSDDEARDMLDGKAPSTLIVDALELNAALDKAREDERKK